MSLTDDEQTRLAATLYHMSNSLEGGFFQSGTRHDEEMHYCPHGKQPQFAYWHRAHLVHFESKLRDSHEALYGNRNISVPYWAWDDTATGQQFVLPPLLRSLLEGNDNPTSRATFQTMLGNRCQGNNGFFGLCGGYSLLPDADITGCRSFQSLPSKIARWLSDAGRGRGSFGQTSAKLEGYHGSVHVCSGAPMSNLKISGFSLLFFFHHANVDRLWEAWKIAANNADKLTEFDGLDTLALKPFNKENVQVNAPPFFVPSDLIDTAPLGYKYDSLPATGAAAHAKHTLRALGEDDDVDEEDDDLAEDARADGDLGRKVVALQDAALGAPTPAPSLTCTNGEEAALAGRINARAPSVFPPVGKWCAQLEADDLIVNGTTTTCDDWYQNGNSQNFRLCVANPVVGNGRFPCARGEQFQCTGSASATTPVSTPVTAPVPAPVPAPVTAAPSCSDIAGRTDSKATLGLYCYELRTSTYQCDQFFSSSPNHGLTKTRLCRDDGTAFCKNSDLLDCSASAPSPPASFERSTTVSFGTSSGCGALTLNNPSFQAHFFLVPANESAASSLPTNVASLPSAIGDGHYIGSSGFFGGGTIMNASAPEVSNVDVDVVLHGVGAMPELADYVPKVVFSLVGCPCSQPDCSYWNTTGTELLTDASFLCSSMTDACGGIQPTTESMLTFDDEAVSTRRS